MQIEGKTVLVAGTGVSGLAAARLLNENHIQTILYDSNANKSKREIYASFDEIGDMQLIFGELQDAVFQFLRGHSGVPPRIAVISASTRSISAFNEARCSS